MVTDARPLRRMPPDDRRELLLQAAVEQFTARPYGAVSIAEIAAAAAVSKALVFRYFTDKRALYVEAMERVVEQVRAASDPDPAAPPHERFDAGLRGFLALVERHPYALPAFEHGEIAADPEIAALAERSSVAVAARVIERMGVADPSPQLLHAVRSWFAFVRITTLEWLRDRSVSRDQLVALQIVTFRAAASAALGLPAAPRGTESGPPYLP